METVKTHVYAPDEEDCLLFHYEFTGLVRKEEIVEGVEARNDMLTYLDGDFHIQISDDLYHRCLALVCDKSEAYTAAFFPTPTFKGNF